MQSFGMNEDKLTNIHGLHAYKNIRAASEGQGPSSGNQGYGCASWLPKLKKTSGNSCEMDFSDFSPMTTANFLDLPQSRSFTSYNYTQ